MFTVHPTNSQRRTLLLAVMASLLLAQTLGLVHRVVHAPSAVQGAAGLLPAQASPALQAARAKVRDVSAAQTQAHPQATAQTRAHRPWLERLFAAHEESGCESYDQLAHSDVLWQAPADFSAQPVTTGTPLPHPVRQLAAQAAGYLARGPPTQV